MRHDAAAFGIGSTRKHPAVHSHPLRRSRLIRGIEASVMELDPLLLSRLQFAFVVSFHAIFPVFTIGLASYIAVLETLLFKTDNPVWERLSKFWTQVFAVVFGMKIGRASCRERV